MEQELGFKLQENRVNYLTQIEIPVTIADFYFPLDPRPLLVFVDGRVHLGRAQMIKDEELRALLRRRGYRILELYYDSYSDRFGVAVLVADGEKSVSEHYGHHKGRHSDP